MKLLAFTFKNEARWIVILSLGVPALGIMVGFVIFLLRKL
jgi:hypothetical protein